MATTRKPKSPGRKPCPRRFAASSVNSARSAISFSLSLEESSVEAFAETPTFATTRARPVEAGVQRSMRHAQHLSQIADKAVDRFRRRVPSAHEPHAGSTDERIEVPAL